MFEVPSPYLHPLQEGIPSRKKLSSRRLEREENTEAGRKRAVAEMPFL